MTWRKQSLVTFDSPFRSSGEATITVSAEAGGTTYVDSAFVTLDSGGASAPQVVDRGKALVSKPVMLAGALAVFLGLVGLLTTVLGSPGKIRRRATTRRLLRGCGRQEGKEARRRLGSNSATSRTPPSP